MNNLRAIVTFVLLLLIVLLAIFQMRIRGYQEVTRINEYVLYYNNDDTCLDQLYQDEDIEYRILCENHYILKSGFSEYSIVDGLQEGIITIEDLKDNLDITTE